MLMGCAAVLCNGDERPFKPDPGIEIATCIDNYEASRGGMACQGALLLLNICQLLFHHFGVPEPSISPGRYDVSLFALRHKLESSGQLSSGSGGGVAGTGGGTPHGNGGGGASETTPLISTPITAHQLYHMQKTNSASTLQHLPMMQG